MSNVFSEIGIGVLDFVQISAGFLLTMLFLFGIKNKKYFWLNYLLLLILTLQCLLLILFGDGLPVKLFAALMLTTTLIIEVVINRRRKPGVARI